MKLGIFLLLGATGCAQVLGIDDTTGAGSGSGGVSLKLSRASVGATVIKSPLDLSAQTASFLAGDASGLVEVPATRTGDTWSADVATGTPPVLFTLPDLPKAHQHLWELPARAMLGTFVALEHPNAQPALPSSMLALQVTLPSGYASTERFEIAAIGAWAGHGLTATELPAPDMGITTFATTIPYSSFAPLSAAPVARITAADAVMLLRYVGNTLTGVLQAPSFDQTDGTDSIAGTMSEVTRDRTLALPLDPALATRYTAARPSVANLGISWTIVAAPGASVGALAGVTLDAGSAAPGAAMIASTYGNPFESLSWHPMVGVFTAETRTAMVDGGNASFAAGLYTLGDLSGGAPALFSAGLPQAVVVDGVSLATDGMSVALDLTKPVSVTMLSDRTSATYYELVLSELTADAATMTVTRTPIVDVIAAPEAAFTLPPSLFQAGHTYVFTAYCVQGGYAMVQAGDLQTVTLPQSFGYLDSGFFTVMGP